MKKVISILCVVAALVACNKPAGKVLFIGVDGLASWCLETALDSIPEQIPNIARLMDEGRWTLDKRAEYQTSSAINWATIFMGVPVEMHGYNRWNSAQPAFTPYALSEHGMPPTLFTLLQEQRPQARSVCIYDWDGIGPVIDTLAVTEHLLVTDGLDQESPEAYVQKYGVPVIEAGMPDFYFFYFVEVDETGHRKGWGSPEYYGQLARTDKAIGLLLDALAQSPDAENTTVILSSDHGGKPDHKHGTYDIRDFRTPLIIWGNGQKAGRIPGCIMQYDLTAHMARLMGLEIPSEWRGKSY